MEERTIIPPFRGAVKGEGNLIETFQIVDQSTMTSKIDAMRRMLRFVNLDKVNVPSHGLGLPMSLRGYYRSTMVWYFHSTGMLSYEGLGSSLDMRIREPPVHLENIVPVSPEYDPFITRACTTLTHSCQSLLRHQKADTDIHFLIQIQKRFYNLDFIA